MRKILVSVRLGALVVPLLTPLRPALAEDRRVAINDAQIATRLEGTEGGRPVVFISGLHEGMDGWELIASAVAHCALAVRYDRPGVGWSRPAPGAPVLAESVARQLQALLDVLEIRQPVVLVAHSLGGLHAQAFARNYPQRTAGIRVGQCVESARAGGRVRLDAANSAWHHFDLVAMLPRLGRAAVHTPPMPHRLLVLAEP